MPIIPARWNQQLFRSARQALLQFLTLLLGERRQSEQSQIIFQLLERFTANRDSRNPGLCPDVGKTQINDAVSVKSFREVAQHLKTVNGVASGNWPQLRLASENTLQQSAPSVNDDIGASGH
jgi:hypothetical protein